MIAADVAGAPHGGGWKCFSPSCLNTNHSKYVGGGCFCSDDTQIRAVLQKAGCTHPPPPPPQIPFGFAKALGDGMVLAAAPKQAIVWGFCDPGASVEVSLDGGANISATVGPDQAAGALTTWRVKLPAMKPGFTKRTITASSAGKMVTLSGVLFGEVWVCSGQSNMEYPIGSPTCWNASNINCTNPRTAQCGFGCTQDAGETITDMANYDSGMRLFNVGGGQSTTPQPEMRGGEWKTPSAMGGAFSATCWFYGRDIYNAMPTKGPVGLISTYVGGTPVQHWTGPDGLAACEGPHSWNWPKGFLDSVLWNAMVVPLLRTVHSGVVWYQGENNAVNPRNYNCSFPAIISDWRRKWSDYTDGATDPEFPFGWAQLNSDGAYGAGYKNASSPGGTLNPSKPPGNCGQGCAPECNVTCLGRFHEWADYGQGFTGIRYAQTNTLSLPKTFQAVIIDTPVASGSIHSPFKQPVGRRLARGGLAVAYGMASAHAVDPRVDSVELSPDKSSLVVNVGGLGSKGLVATIGADAFEVLGECQPQPVAGTCVGGACLCWMSTPIADATKSTVTIHGLPTSPQAIRYLWYISPYAIGGKELRPFAAPIYALADSIPNAAPIPGGADTLPLGPFVLPLP